MKYLPSIIDKGVAKESKAHPSAMKTMVSMCYYAAPLLILVVGLTKEVVGPCSSGAPQFLSPRGEQTWCGPTGDYIVVE